MNPSPTRAGLLIAAATVFVHQTAAQADKSEGSVMIAPHGFTVDAASAVPGATPSTLLFTGSDFSDTAPPPLPPPMPGMPDWSMVLSGLPLTIDAFSIGFDYIQSTPGGVAVIPPGHWAGITFSVTRATAGATNSKIAAEVAAYGGAAADIFFYVLPGSALPPQFVDRTMRSQDSTEINANAPGAPGNIDAHDVYVSLIFKENPQVVPTLPFIRAIFSVSAASVPLVPAPWWGTAPASGATILARDWFAGAWGPPYPLLTPAALGLIPAEDVDALGVDLIRGRVLFSTTRPSVTPGAPLRDPVLYHQMGSPGHFTYMTSTAMPVSTRIGLNPGNAIDDVDGICALDPGGNQPQMNRLIGTPSQQTPFPAPARLGSGVYRRRNQTGGEEFVSWMTGWPSGSPQPNGLAFCCMALGSPIGPYLTVSSHARPAGPTYFYSRFQGHPERFVQRIPTQSSWLGVDVFFTWAVFDSTGIDVAYPVGIKI